MAEVKKEDVKVEPRKDLQDAYLHISQTVAEAISRGQSGEITLSLLFDKGIITKIESKVIKEIDIANG